MRGHTVKSPATVARARQLRAEGKYYREIADELGVSVNTVHAWFTDPDGTKARARKDSYRGECVDCGDPTDGSNGRARAAERCSPCRHAHERAQATWTPHTIIAALHSWAARHDGQTARVNDAHRERAQGDYRLPPPSRVQHVFGSWNAGVKAAGLTPNPLGPRGEYKRLTPLQVKQIARRYAAGESSAQIAADLNCSVTTVLRRVREAGVTIRSSSDAAVMAKARKAEAQQAVAA